MNIIISWVFYIGRMSEKEELSLVWDIRPT